MSHTEVVLFGAGGLLGRHLVQEFQSTGQPCAAFDHQQLDVTDAARVGEILQTLQPQTVINCAALCDFRRCEENPALSEKVNRDAPLRLARQTAERGIKLVQFSSDYIFDGQAQIPYREQDAPHPLSVYGRHKAAVEAGLEDYPGHLLLRVAWLFGKGGRTFLSLLPELLMQQEVLRVAAGKKGSCLHVGWGAWAIRKLVARGSCGRFNLVHSGEASWEAFAAICLEQLRARSLEPRCRELIEVPFASMSELPGSRPAYSVLDLQKLTAEFGGEPVSWEHGLGIYLDDLADSADSSRKTGPHPAISP